MLVMLADFQADGRWPKANDRVKRAEREDVNEQQSRFLRTCELTPSGTITDSGSRVTRNFCTFSGAKAGSGSIWLRLCGVGTVNKGLGTRF